MGYKWKVTNEQVRKNKQEKQTMTKLIDTNNSVEVTRGKLGWGSCKGYRGLNIW